MTQEEKARAYDEALEKAKAHINSKGVGDAVDLCKHLFSELSESEDDRIIQFFAELATDACGGPGQEYYEELGLNYDKVMAWLEKKKEPENTNASTMAPSCWAEEPSLQKEQKPAWSEEDEKRIKQLIYDTEFIKDYYEKKKEKLGEQFNNALIRDCDEQIDWLKSILERFNIQAKQEWSDEDESCWNLIWDILDGPFTAVLTVALVIYGWDNTENK